MGIDREIAISLKNVSKCFKRYEHPGDRLKELLFPGKNRSQEFWALRDINLEVTKGETLGIVGRNGSGKSTLLQIIAGTLTPTTGEVNVNGRISALLELGSGFNPEFTGRQNVFFNGRLLGLKQEEIESKFDEIAAFADIGDFLDQPVKTYSSGMFVRLAFAVAINVEPETLIVDEALAVGDVRFQQRCMSRINQLRERGVSILFVSHDADAVRRICSRAIVIEKGIIVNSGSALNMTNWYLMLSTVDFDMKKFDEMQESVKNRDNDRQTEVTNLSPNNHNYIGEIKNNGVKNNNNQYQSTQIKQTKNQDVSTIYQDKLSIDKSLQVETIDKSSLEFQHFRHGDGKAVILNTIVKNSWGDVVDYVFLGDSVRIDIEVEFLSYQEEHLIGLVIRDRLGTEIIGINTYQEKVNVPKVYSGDKLIYSFNFDIDIKPGHYGICPSISYGQYSMKWLDWIDNAAILKVVDPEDDRIVFGLYLPPKREIKINKAN